MTLVCLIFSINILLSARLPLIRKKRLRGSSFVTSPILDLTLSLTTPRVAGGVCVLAVSRKKERVKRKKKEARITRAKIFLLDLCIEWILIETGNLLFTF